VFTPPAIASEVARHRHREFVARADRFRLSRVNHPSTLSRWPRLRASLLRWLLCLRSRGSTTPTSEDANMGGQVSLDASEEGAIADEVRLRGSGCRRVVSSR
jgi:hypothetical protein